MLRIGTSGAAGVLDTRADVDEFKHGIEPMASAGKLGLLLAKAPANVLMLKRRLGLPITGRYPPAFIERYPELSEEKPLTPFPASPSSS